VIARRIVVQGRVQGVGFRFAAAEVAQAAGATGWVRNRRDGTVETLLIGADAVLAEMEADCHRGPRFSKVDRVERLPTDDDGSVGFTQRPTL